MKIFISHATEDKAALDRPLAEALISAGLDVWYDEYELCVGDSLPRAIEKGISVCDYGIVIISKNFFGKKWTQYELDALMTKETHDRKAILPIWHDVTKEYVESYSPFLASRVALRSAVGIKHLVKELIKAIQNEDQQSGKQSYLVRDMHDAKICPECGSTDLGEGTLWSDFWYIPGDECRKCGWAGLI